MILLGKLEQVTLKKSEEAVTGRMGLSWVAHSMRHYGLQKVLDQHLPSGGKSNREIPASRKIMAGALSLIAGAERVEDIEVLRKDRGLLNALGWESMISPDTLLDYAKEKRHAGKLRKAKETFTVKAMRDCEAKEFTFDGDATYFDSEKESAAYSYQKRKQYSGMLGFIAEMGICNTSDFRPGNISPQTGVLNQLRKAVKQGKAAGKRITRARFDSAGHQNRVFEFCEEEGIHYFISLDKNRAIKECIEGIKAKDWKRLEVRGKESEEQQVEWAESLYSTNAGSTMRILILRWRNPQPDLFEQEPYCYHVIGTNDNEIEAVKWLEFHNGRMNSENYNKELKDGLNMGYAPSHDFQKDRFYFHLNVLAYNMLQVMKCFYLPKSVEKWTVKTMRYWFLQVCGKIVRTGRRYYCKVINVTEKTFALFQYCWGRLRMIL